MPNVPTPSGRSLKTSGASLRRCPSLPEHGKSFGEAGVVSEPAPARTPGLLFPPMGIFANQQERGKREIQPTPPLLGEEGGVQLHHMKTKTLSAREMARAKLRISSTGVPAIEKGCCPIGKCYRDAWPTIFRTSPLSSNSFDVIPLIFPLPSLFGAGMHTEHTIHESITHDAGHRPICLSKRAMIGNASAQLF